MPDIENPDAYVACMRRSLVDKLFFAGIIEPDILVDYGCADGALLHAYAKMFPSTRLVGYDMSETMIKKADDLMLPNMRDRMRFTADWYEVSRILDASAKKFDHAVLASSIFHEAKSYLSPDDFGEFWARLFNSGFRYVVFRDMMVNKGVLRPSDPVQVAKVRSLCPVEVLHKWEDVWGCLEEQHSFVHFLLTYPYHEGGNWERELEENYLPVDLEDFLTLLPEDYRLVHFEHYTLPHLRERVRQDFDIDLVDRTHVKIILERKS